MRKQRLLILLAALTAGLLFWSSGSHPAMAAESGKLKLTIDMPADSSALIEVERVDAAAPTVAVVHTPADGAAQTIALPVGTYRIIPRALTASGTRYVGTANNRQVRISAGATRAATVTYVVSRGVQNLVPTSLTTRSIAMDWEAAAGDGTVVWRMEGDSPTQKPGRGTRVPVTDSSFHDTGLKPGTTYSYSIFARPGDGAFGILDGDPVTFSVGTLPTDPNSGQPTFITTPGTLILAAEEITSVAPTGTGVLVSLRAEVPTPTPGTAVTLPVSDVLAGGYLGEVVDISADGRTILVTPTSLSEAFDLYHLGVPDINTVPDAPTPGAEVPPTEQAKAKQQRSGKTKVKTVTTLEEAKIAASTVASDVPPAATKAAKAQVECSALASGSVTPHLSSSQAGHAEVTLDKHKIWFVELPTGVNFDIGYSATVKGTVDIEVGNGIDCGFPLPKFAKQLTYYPVPMAVMAEPVASISVTGGGTVTNLGFTATLGFETDGYLGLTGDNHLNGKIINSAGPTEPKITAAATIGLSVGGALNFGPGVGTKDAGVIIGIGAELMIADASVSGLMSTNGACIKFEAKSTLSAYLTLRAWIPGFEVDERLKIDALNGERLWGGPWYWPNDCEESTTPTDDVLGPGVTPVGDDLAGSQDQWGKVEGFVPGQNTWVLSTGRVSEAVGAPSFFASTELGTPGDATLSALSGHATHDAAAYTVTLIPNEDTLKVRYAFASEEYPEYVGSQFNDVMAIFVNGQNCALVPESGEAVSINTVNGGKNAQYYVDNSQGASGYGTTMDGLTKPLTCSVQVTPGEPVTVKIAVADASDAIYDSAIALLDGGIWSE